MKKRNPKPKSPTLPGLRRLRMSGGPFDGEYFLTRLRSKTMFFTLGQWTGRYVICHYQGARWEGVPE